MPKAQGKKRNGAAQGSPYSKAGKTSAPKNHTFKMKTDIGQHVLVNPGVSQALVDKADLKQSDVRQSLLSFNSKSHWLRLCSKSVQEQGTSP